MKVEVVLRLMIPTQPLLISVVKKAELIVNKPKFKSWNVVWCAVECGRGGWGNNCGHFVPGHFVPSHFVP